MIKNDKCEKLERLLKGMTSAVLELSTEEDINFIKDGLKELGYEISCEVEDKDQKFYHLHIKKVIGMKNA